MQSSYACQRIGSIYELDSSSLVQQHEVSHRVTCRNAIHHKVTQIEIN